MKQLKKLLFGLLIIAALLLTVVLVAITYVDIHASEAKDYLIEKYDFKKNQLFAVKYVEYAYEDITDCSSLWFKECTDNKDLLYEYSFKTKNGDKIVVTEDVNGVFSDNYKDDDSEVDNETIEDDIQDEDTEKQDEA